MNNKSNKVFVSAHLSNRTAEANSLNHAKAMDMLRREGINYVVVEGVYKKVAQLSFMLYADSHADHEDNLLVAVSLAQLFKQESYLEVHNDDAAVLHYTGGSSEKLGKFTEVDKDTASKNNCYTHLNGRYFVVI